MMRLRRASMIAALPLLAWAATASAECAWVLWQEYRESGKRELNSPVDAYATKDECRAAVDKQIAATKELAAQGETWAAAKADYYREHPE